MSLSVPLLPKKTTADTARRHHGTAPHLLGVDFDSERIISKLLIIMKRQYIAIKTTAVFGERPHTGPWLGRPLEGTQQLSKPNCLEEQKKLLRPYFNQKSKQY